MTNSGWTMRLGEACMLALSVAALAAVPTALRTHVSGGGLLDGLLVGTAALLPFVSLLVVLLRVAGRGLRGVMGTRANAAATLSIALLVGLALPALSVVAGLLKSLTHHRGLGGATFGVVGLGVVIACALVARRMVDLGQNLVSRGVRPVHVAVGGAIVSIAPLVVLAVTLARAATGQGAGSVGSALVDLAIALVATALAASIELRTQHSKIAATFGVPCAALLMLTASARLASSPTVGRSVQTGGGLAATLLSALEKWTDQDGDGVGAHFGGDDCDEGDSRRHPGAVDVPGDGVDQDCDGTDAKVANSVPGQTPSPAGSDSAAPANAGAAKPLGDTSHPDILLITLDTVRADHTSVYGYEHKTTPYLEQLAAKGVVFAHAYAPGSDTQRAIMPLVSGKPLSQTVKERREWPTIPSDVDTVAERLKRVGYATAAVASFTWLSDEKGFDQGFDRFEQVYREEHPERSVTGALATRSALAILDEFGGKDAPIFLWVHLFDAHERYQEHAGKRFGRGPAALYDGEVAFVDKQIGQIAAYLAKSKRTRPLAWLVHGTHGEGFGEHATKGHGTELYEEMLRVPLVVVLPEGKTGRYEAGAVTTMDLAPTILALAGASAEGVTGVSLVPHARLDPAAPKHGPIFAYGSKRAAVIDWPMKLIAQDRKKQNRNFLFDLAIDPREEKDLSNERVDDVTRLEKLLSDLATTP
ncbi:MAG TPA: sulfatase-like hydrolase/transferase [Polyangium sp.]|nr:sulfatase-like hydrolase/transferase [Polyangium sp.]